MYVSNISLYFRSDLSYFFIILYSSNLVIVSVLLLNIFSFLIKSKNTKTSKKIIIFIPDRNGSIPFNLVILALCLLW